MAEEAKARATTGVTYVRRSIIPTRDIRGDDFYPTPPAAVRALLDVESFDGPIWEPACGDGSISKTLIESGYTVVSTDLVERGYGTSRVDFLMETKTLAPNIITNPPFKIAVPFLLRALDLSTKKVAFLCRLAWLEGKARGEIYRTTPIARVWVFSERVPMLRNGDAMLAGGGGMIAFAWFVWDKGYIGAPTLGWINAKSEPPPGDGIHGTDGVSA